MPSLRRTVSDSAGTVRTSPYSSALSLSAAGALNAGIPIRPRRTGSESSGRRVLADIEWWRILDGQQEEEVDSANENGQVRVANAVQEPAGEQITVITMMNTSTNDGDDGDDAAVSSPDASQGASSLMTPFAALSISSVAPMTPPRSRSAFDSVESTPESSPRTPALQHHMLFTDVPAFDCTNADADFCTPLPPFLGARPSVLNAMSMMRSVSFGGFDAPRESADERFGDVIFI